jgi:aconitate hydratase
MSGPRRDLTLEITRSPNGRVRPAADKDGAKQSVPVKLRIDTPIEIDYYRHGGILPFVLRELISRSRR